MCHRDGWLRPQVNAFTILPEDLDFRSMLTANTAREASKRIVEDLLLTAGGDISDELEDSPSIVKRGGLLEEDTF